MIALFTFLLSLESNPAVACGPSIPDPVFASSVRPENFADFAQGKIGILQPSFYRSTLFVAYRILNDLPLSNNEQNDVLRAWQMQYERVDANAAAIKNAIDGWLAVRKQVLPNGPEPSIKTFRTAQSGYDFFENCTAGAFYNASKTLNARIATYTVINEVQEWVKAQDQVFENCSETKPIPSEAAADAPDWLKYDRDYQIASAQFYAMHYDEAKERFSKIAQNKQSPWHQLASYLLARVAVRKMPDEQAIAQINAVLANEELSDYHASAKQLLNYVNFRLQPLQLHEALTKKLLMKNENTDFFQDLVDYWRLLNTAELSDYNDNTEARSLQLQFRQASELTDWVFTIQDKENNAFKHAIDQWRSTKKLVWLVASLIKAPNDSLEAPELISSSLAIKSDSPAYLTANYYAMRLQIAGGQVDEARKTLDMVLVNDSLPIDKLALNQLYSLRMLVAQNIDEFVKYAQRRVPFFVIGLDYGFSAAWIEEQPPLQGEDDYSKEREWLKRTMFAVDATRTLNLRTPLAILKKIALHPDLPDYLKSRLVMSVWTRAILLEDDQTALEFAPYVAQYIPDVKDYISQFLNAKDKQTRTFEAIWLMLNNPAMRPLVDIGLGRRTDFNVIDNLRDNWWCDSDFDNRFFNESGEVIPDFPAPIFLTQTDISIAANENAKIASFKGGSPFLANQTVQWTIIDPVEKRLPEALHLAVKTTRYSCESCATSKASKAAFDVLNKRFKSSEWKKKTPYWFGQACTE